MSGNGRKDVILHLSDEELNQLLAEADDPKAVRHLTFIKNPYEGDTLEEAINQLGSLN
nr:hypothetical protein [Halostagnicola kamekurae]